jgi:hypothetical protein
MKKSIYAGILGLFLIAVVSASQLTIIDDLDSFTGVKLMIESSDGVWGSPIYPDEMFSAGGVAKFNIESTETAVNLDLIFINHGEVVKELEKGPFDLTKDNEIDLREGADEKNVSVESNESENDSVESVNNELMNVSVETALRINSIVVDDVDTVIENESGNSSDGVTGFSISSMMDSKLAPWTFGLLGLVVIVVVVFVVAKVAYKKGVEAEMKDITRFSEMNKNL